MSICGFNCICEIFLPASVEPNRQMTEIKSNADIEPEITAMVAFPIRAIPTRREKKPAGATDAGRYGALSNIISCADN